MRLIHRNFDKHCEGCAEPLPYDLSFKMKLPRTSSIRSRLTFLVLAYIIPASILAVMLVSYDYQITRAGLVKNAEVAARATALAVDSEFAILESNLLVLATSPSLANQDLATFYAQATEVGRIQGVNNIVLSDMVGKQYVNTLLPFGAALPEKHDNPRLRRVYETGEAVISNLFIGPVSKRPTFAVGVPVRRGSTVLFALSAGMPTERFGKLLSLQNLPPDWVAVILDRNGTIVARTHDIQRYIGKKTTPDLLERMLTSQDGAFESTTTDGMHVLAVLSRAPNSKWSVAIGIPSKILSAELDRKFMWLVVATALLLGGSLLLAWRVGGTIGHAVSGLVEPALALGSGKVVEPKSFNLREANEVGMALARASKMLLLAQYHASHDMLTGLANRGLFQDFIDQELALCQRNGACLSVLYIDLNDFKKINDKHGHATGDKLLLAVAERFKVTLRKSDLAARLGGDEFAVVLVNTPEEEAQHVAAKLVDCLASTYYIDELVINTSASIGVAGFPDSGTTSKTLLHNADIAMYRAKAKHRQNPISVPS